MASGTDALQWGWEGSPATARGCLNGEQLPLLATASPSGGGQKGFASIRVIRGEKRRRRRGSFALQFRRLTADRS